MADGMAWRGLSPTVRRAFYNLATTTDEDGRPRHEARTLARLADEVTAAGAFRLFTRLCHLVVAARAAGEDVDRFLLLVPLRRARWHPWRAALAADRPLGRFMSLDEAGQRLRLDYPDAAFDLHLRELPKLAALYELLVEVLGYAAMAGELRKLPQGTANQRVVQDGGNGLLRAWRAAVGASEAEAANDHDRPGSHHVTARKLPQLADYVRQHGRREADGPLLDDALLLSFWLERSLDGSSGFRLFRSTVEAGIALLRASEACRRGGAADNAATIGDDADAGEIDLDRLAEGAMEQRDIPCHRSLGLLSEPPLDKVNFLLKTNRQRLAMLDAAGFEALDLPLSILRADTFGATQAFLARNRSTGAAAEGHSTSTYEAHFDGLADIDGKLEEAILASLHVLQSSLGGIPRRRAPDDEPTAQANEVIEALPEPLAARAKTAWGKVDRAGFRPARTIDPDLQDAHLRGCEILTACRDQLDRWRTAVAELWRERFSGDPKTAPNRAFAEDEPVFTAQFRRFAKE